MPEAMACLQPRDSPVQSARRTTRRRNLSAMDVGPAPGLAPRKRATPSDLVGGPLSAMDMLVALFFRMAERVARELAAETR